VFASYLIRVSPTDNRILPYYLFFFLASERYQAFVSGASTGTTRKSLSAPGITAIDLVVPPLSVQQRFDEAVRPVRQQMAGLLGANAVLRKTRDLVLPRLISGEIDLEELDISMEEAAA
jgi:type I restriction enzyme, S subunit